MTVDFGGIIGLGRFICHGVKFGYPIFQKKGNKKGKEKNTVELII